MGAAGEQHIRAVFGDDQVLFVAKAVGRADARRGAEKRPVGGWPEGAPPDPEKTVSSSSSTVRRASSSPRMMLKRRIQPDVRDLPARADRQVRIEGARPNQYIGALVAPQKRGHAAAVVVMPVGQDRRVHFAHVHAIFSALSQNSALCPKSKSSLCLCVSM
jgi:hypothetical protein